MFGLDCNARNTEGQTVRPVACLDCQLYVVPVWEKKRIKDGVIACLCWFQMTWMIRVVFLSKMVPQIKWLHIAVSYSRLEANGTNNDLWLWGKNADNKHRWLYEVCVWCNDTSNTKAVCPSLTNNLCSHHSSCLSFTLIYTYSESVNTSTSLSFCVQFSYSFPPLSMLCTLYVYLDILIHLY